jgi:hypothetical protein
VVERGWAWYAEAAGRSLPDSPYGRVLYAAASVWFQRAGITDGELPDPARLADGFALDPGGPAWLAGLGTILGAWRAAGRLDDCRTALAAATEAHDRSAMPSALASGALAVELAAIEAADGRDPTEVAAIARGSLAPLRRVDAAWWIARALRTLERVGEATAEERAEAVAIEHRLGSIGPTDVLPTPWE